MQKAVHWYIFHAGGCAGRKRGNLRIFDARWRNVPQHLLCLFRPEPKLTCEFRWPALYPALLFRCEVGIPLRCYWGLVLAFASGVLRVSCGLIPFFFSSFGLLFSFSFPSSFLSPSFLLPSSFLPPSFLYIFI